MMSGTQRIFKSILPAAWAESMEKESREWMTRCENCRFEKSVRDSGGIRRKASGNPRRKFCCRSCNHHAWHATYRKEID